MTVSCASDRPPLPEHAPSAWVANSMSRIGEYDAPDRRTGADLIAARGEVESLQVVASGGNTGLTGLDLSIGVLTGPDGATLPTSGVTRYRQHYIEVTEGSPDRGGSNRPTGPGTYADALVPFVHPETGEPLDGEIRAAGVDIDAGVNQPYWIDLDVPRDAAPGTYEGAWTLTADGFEASGRITLSVSTAVLPTRPSLRSLMLNWGQRPSVSRELLRNKLVPTSALPPQADPLADVVNVVDVGLFSGADQNRCLLDPPPPVEEIRATAARQARPDALLLNYTADEIGSCDGVTDAVREWSRALHAAGVAQLLTQEPDPALFDDGTGRPAVDIWALLPKQHVAEPALVDEAQRRGAEVWSYNALVQDSYSPKWLIDFAPMDFRIQPGFLNQRLGLTGILYWRVDNWTDRPWENVQTYDGGYPGEGQLVYPGEQVGITGGAVPSMRLKWLRDGVEDYELIALARERDPARTTEVIGRVASGWEEWTKEPSRLLDARAELLDLSWAN